MTCPEADRWRKLRQEYGADEAWEKAHETPATAPGRAVETPPSVEQVYETPWGTVEASGVSTGTVASPPLGAGESKRRDMGVRVFDLTEIIKTLPKEDGSGAVEVASVLPDGTVTLNQRIFENKELAAWYLRQLADKLDGGPTPKRGRKKVTE